MSWINERWPLSPFIRIALEEEMAGGSSFAYVFGSAALIIFLLQAATGIWQFLYYIPTIAEGYNSLNYLRTEVPLGWLIHGLHYWGANAMIVLVLLHFSQVFIWGAYKRPHELQWITGVFLFLLTMAMSLTGGALPWDKRSYWLVEVASSAAGSMPLVGDVIKKIMLSGGIIGQLTLSRFFILHAAILSGTLFTIVLIHLVALRKAGNAGPWNENKRRQKGPFWPDQVFKDGFAASFVIVILIGLCFLAPPPYSGMADPLDGSYVPKPEWNFLFFYEALKYFPGRLEIIASMGIPLIGTLVLLFVPFVDRSEERRPLKRPVAMLCWTAGITIFIVLTLVGAFSKTGETAAGPAVTALPAPASNPKAAAPVSLSASEKAGSDLVHTKGCLACHSINGVGGKIGTDLSDEGTKGRSREWLQDQLNDPKKHNPASVMPSFSTLGPVLIGQIADYLLGLKGSTSAAAAPAIQQQPAATSAGPHGQTGKAATIIGSADHGGILFGKNCSSCHGPRGKGGIANPGSKEGMVPPLNPIDRDEFNSDPQTFAAKIDLYLQHGSRPEGQSPALSMLPFGDTNALTQQQIADLEAYILSLNGVDRGMIKHPGIEPDIFFIITAFLFSLICLNLWGWWWFSGLGVVKKKEKNK